MSNEDFMDWFDDFVEKLKGSSGGPYIGNLGSPVIPNPNLVSSLDVYLNMRGKYMSDKSKERKRKIEKISDAQRIEELEKRVKELEDIIKSE